MRLTKTVLTAILSVSFLFYALTASALDKNILDEDFVSLGKIEQKMQQVETTLSQNAATDIRPERVYAMLDLADLSKNSRMQSHELGSLNSASNLLKTKTGYSDKEISTLKRKTLYALKDFSRRRAYVIDVAEKAKDKQLLIAALKLKQLFADALVNLTSIHNKLKASS